MKRIPLAVAAVLLTLSLAALATDPTAPRTDVHGADATLTQTHPAGYGVLKPSTVVITVSQSQPPPDPFAGLAFGCNIGDYTTVPASNGNPCSQGGMWTTWVSGQTLTPGHWRATFYVETSGGALVGSPYSVTWTWTMNHSDGSTTGGSCSGASCVVDANVMANNNFGQRVQATAHVVYTTTGATKDVLVTASNSACGTRNVSTGRTVDCQ